MRGFGQQIYLFMFADDLVIENRLVVPSVLLVGVFLTHTSSEMIRMLLLKYGNPLPMLHQETAAAVEHFSEEFLRKRQNMKHSIVSDMTVEEQVEVSNAAAPMTTKESIKVQYHWSNVVDDTSKGKYIGILERILICIFVIYDIYQGLMLLGAMKTLARFKLFENKAFAEYYLIGTLASLIAAIVCGFILKRMLLDALLV
ncbi:hypothetical protein [Cohnella kolymensis]|uniref:hypothetical protein n=1 Tax=Cohnella kolymensis TaxID=1590652 RepID=UPI0013792877|nr:hypothetical protein [Cohnella kolymensis]